MKIEIVGGDTHTDSVTARAAIVLVAAIFITGRPENYRLDTQKGVTAVLEKPLDLPLLLGVVERALGERAEARHNANRRPSP